MPASAALHWQGAHGAALASGGGGDEDDEVEEESSGRGAVATPFPGLLAGLRRDQSSYGAPAADADATAAGSEVVAEVAADVDTAAAATTTDMASGAAGGAANG
eukprot:4387941-Prymnesium_polylepis.1